MIGASTLYDAPDQERFRKNLIQNGVYFSRSICFPQKVIPWHSFLQHNVSLL